MPGKTSWETPIGDDPLNRYLQIQRLEDQLLKQLTEIARETGNDLTLLTEKKFRASKSGDPRTLRGIPVVGVPGGMGGVIPGTNPLAALMQKQPREDR
jgi:hypothetical protein